MKLWIQKLFLISILCSLFTIPYSKANAQTPHTYYVATDGSDGNPGTLSQPWKTIAKVNSTFFIPGDSILFKRGDTWREQLNVPSSGTSGNPITFGAYGSGDMPKIYGSTQITAWTNESGNLWFATNASDPGLIWFVNQNGSTAHGNKESLKTALDAQYDWWWDNSNARIYIYAVSNPGSSYVSIEMPTRDFCVTGGKDYITITDLNFAFPKQYAIVHTKWNSSGVELSTPGWVVKNSKFTNCGISLFGPNTIITDNEFVGPSPNTGPDGAIIIRGKVASNCRVIRNTISGYSSRGVWFLDGADSPTASENIIHDIGYTPGTNQEGYCINFDGYGFPITGTVTATKNHVYNCLANGIEMENSIGSSVISRNLIHDCFSGILYMNYAACARYPEQRGLNVNGLVDYNIIYHNNYAIRIDDASGINVWNNVLYGGTGSYPGGLIIFDDGKYFVNNIDFRNNIIGSNMTKTVSTAYAWRNHFKVFDNNIVVNPVFEERDSRTYLSLTQLKAGNTAMNCSLASPGFVNPAGYDFHLLPNSVCINTGTDVKLLQDFDGNIVPQDSVPDIGVYEYSPTTFPTHTPPAPTPTTTPKPGDSNGDGNVDGQDYVKWLTYYGSSSTGPTFGDFDNNSTVDGRDYVVWLNNYESKEN
jgi:hypothetical protein